MTTPTDRDLKIKLMMIRALEKIRGELPNVAELEIDAVDYALEEIARNTDLERCLRCDEYHLGVTRGCCPRCNSGEQHEYDDDYFDAQAERASIFYNNVRGIIK